MGEYECIAVNGIPPAKSKSIQLYVNCKKGIWIFSTFFWLFFFSVAPHIQTPNNMIGATMFSSVTINCFVEAFPAAIIYWADQQGLLFLWHLYYIWNYKLFSVFIPKNHFLGRILVSSNHLKSTTKNINHFRKKASLYITNTTIQDFQVSLWTIVCRKGKLL